MSESIQVNGIQIDSITITATDGETKYNINDIVIEFNIYESSEQPFMTADFVITDAVALTTRIPIVGGEKVEVTFHTPVDGMKDKPFSKTFRVFAIKKFSVYNKARKADYILRCFDVEYFNDLTKKVQKSYADKPVSDMVADIAKEYLSISELKTNSPTDGMPTIVVPNLNPSEAILSLLCRYAKSKEYGEVSNYTFFSSQDGYHFTSYEDMIDLKKKGSDYQIDKYTFTEKNLLSRSNVTLSPEVGAETKQNTPTPDPPSESARRQKSKKPEEFLRIDDFEFVNKMDVEKALSAGMFDNVIYYINPTVRSYQRKIFNYLKEFEKMKHLFLQTNVGKGFPIVGESNEEFANLKGDSKHIYLLTNEGNQHGNPIVDDKRYEFSGFRNASISMLNSVIVNLYIPGDNTRKVGDIIEIVFPEYGATDDILGEVDRFVSGAYLVTAVRHLHNIEGGYTCILRCQKNCFEESVEKRLTNSYNSQMEDEGKADIKENTPTP